MIYKLKRFIQNYFLLFLTFFMISIFSMGVIIKTFDLSITFKRANSLFSKYGKRIQIICENPIYSNELINLLNNKQFILETYVTNNNEFNAPVVGIFYNYNINKTYPIIDGRMFSLDDFKKKQKVALVGYNILNHLTPESIIDINNEKYKVIGILGDKSNNILNNTIYINLNSTNLNLSSNPFNIESKQQHTNNLIDSIYSSIVNKKNNINIISNDIVGSTNPLIDSIGLNKSYINILIMVTLCLILTIINISSYWIENKKKELGVKKLLGGTSTFIIIEFFKYYYLTVSISSLCSMLIFCLFYKFNIVSFSNISLYHILQSTSVLLIINLFTGTLATIPSIRKLSTLQINTILKIID